MSNERHEFSPDQRPVAERRSSERVTSVYRPVLIEAKNFVGFCLLRNLSSGGMMGKAFSEFAVGQQIKVRLPSDTAMSGTISWSKEGNIGIRFDDEIDVDQVLRQLSEKKPGEQINRPPRLAIDCVGSLEIGQEFIRIRLHDISQRGIKAEIKGVKPGDEGVVHLPGLECQTAVVRWTHGELAGLNFVSPLAFGQLALWVIERQSPLR